MRALGYPRIISMENFKTPNFELVADILYWLVNRFDQDFELADDIEDERDRVKFVQNVAKFFLSKARIKLNMKKIYQADGYAVQELLKLANMLYKAVTTSNQDEDDSALDFGSSSKLQNVKAARSLASEITESGAKLFDLLEKEEELKSDREKALQFLDNISRIDSNKEQDYIRKCIKDIVSTQTGSLSKMESMLGNLENDEKNLEAKIKKKTQDLERAEKRMKSLQGVRPAFRDEYDNLEYELKALYEVYVVKFRNLSYLEHDLEEYSRTEMEKKKAAQKILEEERAKIQEEEMRILRGEQEIDEAALDAQMLNDFPYGGPERPSSASRRGGQRGDYRNMGDDDEDELSGDEDEEMLIDEDDEDSEEQGIDDDEDSEDNDF